MDILRCKTPGLVRKEVWTHILAYNLLRTIMAQAAACHGIPPRKISFKAALQTIEAFQPAIAIQAARNPEQRRNLYRSVLQAIRQHRVGDRRDRFESRLRKRSVKKYPPMTIPRNEMKRLIDKGIMTI